MRGLNGKVAIVTGGGQGIGRALSLRLAQEGAKVATFDLKPQAGDETAALAGEGATVNIYALDVGDGEAVDTAVAAVEAYLGPVWALVNKPAADDKGVSSVVLTGAGDKAFCTGGDQSAHEGQYDGRGIVGLPIHELQSIIHDIPKPVIARVNGFAIGGGNVFATLCDLTIAADTAKLGQVGPKVGSVDGGWGAALLARHVGDKKAREIWHLNEQYTAQQALEMGLVNKVVPVAELDAAVDAWTDVIGERSPTALAPAKRSFNAATESICGISQFALQAVKLFYDTAESKEGVNALTERRKPDFHAHVK